jgi:hypothetical protein
LAAAVERHVRTAGTVLSQALPKLKRLLRQHRPLSRAASALVLSIEMSDNLASTLGYAVTEVDRQACEAAGGHWDRYDVEEGEDCT